MKLQMKRILSFAGSAVAVAGIFFVGLRLCRFASQVDFSRFSASVWGVMASLVLVYGIANYLLSHAWRCLLAHCGVTISGSQALKIFGVSQLAKYVPGNVFHFVGRQSLGLAAGLPGWALVKSSVGEIVLISFAGGLFVLLLLPLLLPYISISVSMILFGAVLLSVSGVVRYYFGFYVVIAFLGYLIFLTVSGAVFVCLLVQLSDLAKSGLQYLPLGGAYIIAWLAGLLMPGAPAGVGVREFVLLFLLKGTIGEGDLLLAIVSGRFVTVLGDLLFFFFSSLIQVKQHETRS